METIGKLITLLDWAKSLDPDGRTAEVAELLSKTNPMLTTMPFKEGNLPTGHKTTVRAGLPTPTWRKLNYGVQPSKSLRAEVVDTCGMLEARNHVDKDLAELNGNTAAFRLSEALGEVEGMNQAMAETVFYGDTAVNPERFLGLTPRYNALTGAPISQNVITAGGASTDNTSVWLIAWGENTIHGIFPKGSKAGLVHEDLGLQDVVDADGGYYRAYKDWWQWKNGLCVRDWRYAVRICNVKIADLLALGSTQALTAATSLIKLMIKAKHRLPYANVGTPVFYCNRTVRQMLDIMALEKSSAALSIREAAGQFETNFLGIPVHTCDALVENEAAVS